MSEMGWQRINVNKEDWGDNTMRLAFVFDSTVSLICGCFLFDGPEMIIRALAVDIWLGLYRES